MVLHSPVVIVYSGNVSLVCACFHYSENSEFRFV